MKHRNGNRVLLVVNLLLTFALVILFAKTGLLTKTARKITGAHTPVMETDHYKMMVWLHERPISQALASAEIEVAFVGDSIIEGWLTSNTVPNSLNLGISRDTVSGLIARTKPELVEHVPAWYLGIGVNDALTGADPKDIPGQVGQLADLFRHADTLIWRSVLPVGSADWTQEQEAFRTAFNSAAQQTCLAMANCTFLTPPPLYSENVSDWTSDGLHPNAEGYRQLADQLCSTIPCLPQRP